MHERNVGMRDCSACFDNAGNVDDAGNVEDDLYDTHRTCHNNQRKRLKTHQH